MRQQHTVGSEREGKRNQNIKFEEVGSIWFCAISYVSILRMSRECGMILGSIWLSRQSPFLPPCDGA